VSSPSPSLLNPGFSHGLRQPTIRVRLDLPKALLEACRDQAELDRTRSLIEDRLMPDASTNTGLATQPPDQQGSLTPADPRDQLAGLIGRTANSILQAIRIPSFDLQKAVFNPGAEGRLDLFGPVVEHVPFSLFEQSYSLAANLINALIHSAGSEETNAAFDSLQKSFIKPLSDRIPGGKSTIPMLRVAHQLGIPFRHLGGGVYQLGWGASARLMDRTSLDLDSSIGARISTDKERTATILRMAGLPVPRHWRVHTIEEAESAASAIGFPLVVKPNNRDRGEGVTVNVTNIKALADAFAEAQKFSKQILIEEQIPGICHRVFVAHGRLLFAVKRNPKSVIGDGEKTVQELIDAANQAELQKAEHKRLEPWPQDALAMECMQAAGYSLKSIPEKNKRVPLRPMESTEWGGDSESMTEHIHPDNIQLAIDAARLLRLEVAGIDLMTTDISKPWHANQAAVNEVNYAPFLGSSRPRTQAAMVRFFEDFFPGQGRIPVVAYVGGDEAKRKALEEQLRWAKKKVGCFFCSHNESRSPQGPITHFGEDGPAFGLFERVQSLLMNRSAERLVVLIQNNDLLRRGLPMDRFSRVIHVGKEFQPAPGLRELLQRQSHSN
jgi:cyanophycin synthetase